MYLGLLLIAIVVFAAIATVFSGGIFTIILVPVAVLGALGAVTALIAERAAGIEGTQMPDAGKQPPGRIRRRGEPLHGDVPATPDDYVRALQRSQ